MWNPKGPLAIVLPAFNEERDLPRLLERIHSTLRRDARTWQVIVVDDGSSDRTAEVARSFSSRMPIRVLVHEVNRGLPAALATGIRAALDHRAGTVVTLDADDTQDPSLIPYMLARLGAGHDVVIASRFASGGQEIGVPAHRKALSRAAGMVLGILAPVPGVRDYSCGYRAYRGDLLLRLADRHERDLVADAGFACMVDLLLKAKELDARVGEVPLVLRYDRKAGASKMRIVRTSLRYGSVLWAHRRRLLERELAARLPGRNAAVRAASRAFGALALTLALPIMLLVGVLARLTTDGPIFIREPRVGPDRRRSASPDVSPRRRHRDLGGRPFQALRFRTRADLAPSGTRECRLSAWLRRTRLDRLPQLFNVVRGDVDLFGPGGRSRTGDTDAHVDDLRPPEPGSTSGSAAEAAALPVDAPAEVRPDPHPRLSGRGRAMTTR